MKTIVKYLKSQLNQLSTWLGFISIAVWFLLPNIFLLGVFIALIILPDIKFVQTHDFLEDKLEAWL